MGGDRQKTQQTQQTQYTATPEEREMERAQLEQFRQVSPYQTQVQKSGLNLSNLLLGGQQLPGYLQGLTGGIDENQIQNIVRQSLRDIPTSLQASGILDSGEGQEYYARQAAGVRSNVAQFNIQNLQQLLNQALGGQAQVQQPINQATGMLGSQLAGLRSINQTGTTTTIGMNPFLKSFQQGAGSEFGKQVGSGFGRLTV